MSTNPPKSEGFRSPSAADASNFNVSFNGNKNGQGFAIYIVPSGPPTDAQNDSKKEVEASPSRALEGRPPQVGQENDIRIQQTFGNYSPSALQTQAHSSTQLPNSNMMRVTSKEELSYHRGIPSQAYDKVAAMSHWKVAKVNRPEKEDVYNWSRTATSKLLDLYTSDKYFERFKDRFTKKKVLWNEIAEYLNREGYTMGIPLSGDQCANKFRNLKKVYVKCKNQSLNANESLRRSEYFAQLHTIFSQLSPSHDMQTTDYPRDPRASMDSEQHLAIEHYDRHFQGNCLSPQEEYDYSRHSQPDYVDLSHSPIETKPVFTDNEVAVKDKDVESSGYENETVNESESRLETDGSAQVRERQDDGATKEVPRTNTEADTETKGTKRKHSERDNESEIPPKVVCVNDSDEETEESEAVGPSCSVSNANTTVTPQVTDKDETRVSASFSPQSIVEVFQRHLEDRNRAFSNFMKSVMEMHAEETKLLSSILEVLQKSVSEK